MAAPLSVFHEPFCSLRDAWRESSVGGTNVTTPSGATSEEDHDDPILSDERRLGPGTAHTNTPPLGNSPNHERDLSLDDSTLSEASSVDELPVAVAHRKDIDTYVLSADDQELRNIIRRGLERVRL